MTLRKAMNRSMSESQTKEDNEREREREKEREREQQREKGTEQELSAQMRCTHTIEMQRGRSYFRQPGFLEVKCPIHFHALAMFLTVGWSTFMARMDMKLAWFIHEYKS